MKASYAMVLVFLALLLTLPLPIWFFDGELYILSYLKLLLSFNDYFWGLGLLGKVLFFLYLLLYVSLCFLLAFLFVKKIIPNDLTKRTAFTGLFILSMFFLFSSFEVYSLLNGLSVSFLALYA